MSKQNQKYINEILESKNIDLINEIINKNPTECYDFFFQSEEKSSLRDVTNRLVDLYKLKCERIHTNAFKNLIFLSACYLSNVDIANELLNDQDIDINLNCCHVLAPPLHLACENESVELVKLLVKSKLLKINLISKGCIKNAALHTLSSSQSGNYTAQEQILQLLIKHGASLEVRNCFSETPLHVALYYENYEFAKCLIKQGSNVYLTTNNGKSCLDYCLEHDNHSSFIFFKHLIQNYNFSSKLLSILDGAIKNDSLEFCRLILGQTKSQITSEFMENLVNLSIKNDSNQVFTYLVTNYTIKVSVDELISTFKEATIIDPYLVVIVQRKLIKDFRLNSSKLLEFVSNEHLSQLRTIGFKFKTRTDVEIKLDVLKINDLFASRLYLIIKHSTKIDYAMLMRVLLSNFLINNSFITRDLWLYDEEKVLCIFKHIVLSGYLSQFEVFALTNNFQDHIQAYKPKYKRLTQFLMHNSRHLLSLKELCRIRIRLFIAQEPNAHKIYLNSSNYYTQYIQMNDIYVPKEWKHL